MTLQGKLFFIIAVVIAVVAGLLTFHKGLEELDERATGIERRLERVENYIQQETRSKLKTTEEILKICDKNKDCPECRGGWGWLLPDGSCWEKI